MKADGGSSPKRDGLFRLTHAHTEKTVSLSRYLKYLVNIVSVCVCVFASRAIFSNGLITRRVL